MFYTIIRAAGKPDTFNPTTEIGAARAGRKEDCAMKRNKLSVPIRVKLLASLSLISLFSGLSLLIGSIFVYQNVSGQVMTLASKTLDVYANQIDLTLSDLQQYSYTTIFASDFQNDLVLTRDSKDEYEILLANNRIHDRLFLCTVYSDLIDRVDLYSTEAGLLNSSSRHITQDNAACNVSDIMEANGRVVWGISRGSGNMITLSRLIRTINNNFTHIPLSIISFYIDTDDLTNVSSLNQDFYTSSFVIADRQENILYSSSDVPGITDTQGLKAGSLNRFQGKSYFSIHKSSSVTPWNYYLLIPEEEVLGSIPLIFRICGIILLLLFIVTFLFCIRMAQHITRPLSSLAMQMDRVAHGDFQLDASRLLQYTDGDEIQDICLHFIRMNAQIDRLITENYKVTLLNRDAQLKSLQAQMNPHFLYNALDSINWMAKLAGQPVIASSVQSLSVLLRKTTNSHGKETVLEEELNLLDHYLAIQKLRFQDRLIFEKEVAPEVLGVPLPVLTLQPIVENSIKYALERMETPCRIRLRAELEDGCSRITIADNGPGIPDTVLAEIVSSLSMSEEDTQTPALTGSGIGLKNAALRIRLLYHIPQPLTIHNNETAGVTVTITLPLPDSCGVANVPVMLKS